MDMELAIKSTSRKRKLRKKLVDFSFLFPVLFMFVAFVVFPFLWGIPLSFTDWDGLSATRNFINFDNYVNIFSDPHIPNAFKNTAVFAVLTLVVSNVLGLLIALLRGYKRWISPLLGHHCRFIPTCSEYAMQALAVHGLFKGLLLTVWRLLRCNPFGKFGYDPVPPRGRWVSDERRLTRG